MTDQNYTIQNSHIRTGSLKTSLTLRAIAFTDKGQSWAQILGIDVDRGIPVIEWAKEYFYKADALLFIGAIGIAVRAIAPLVKDKTTDPAVIVMDEAGQHVIPILSGHIGGANALAKKISSLTGATPVITTATDLQGLPAIDKWAVDNNIVIENPYAIKTVSSQALAGKSVGVAITERTIQPPFEVTLYLRPRTLVLGVGCKKGISPDFFEKKALEFLRFNGVSLLSVKALASIDLKKDESALCHFCNKYHICLLTYDAQVLRAIPGTFTHSDFVEKTVGVDNVCERAAVKASGGILLTGKTEYEGITFALAGEESI